MDSGSFWGSDNIFLILGLFFQNTCEDNLELSLASERVGFGSGTTPKLIFFGQACLRPDGVVLIAK